MSSIAHAEGVVRGPPAQSGMPEPHHGLSRNRKAWFFILAALLIVTVAIVGIKVIQIRTMINAGASFEAPPETVTSFTPQRTEWEVTQEAVATLVAVHGGTIGSEVSGRVREISFKPGSFVRRGSILVRLDTSVEEAQLSAARADAELASRELGRARTLREKQANTPAELDTASTRGQQTAATVKNLEATIAKKTIRAPYDGRISIREVELGQVIAPGTTIASLQSVTPMHADFWFPQNALANLAVGNRVKMKTDVAPAREWDGEVTTINPEVNTETRNVRVRATFPNEDGFLRPGVFCNVKVISPERKSVLVVPATAVLFAPYGDSVFVLENDRAKGQLVAKQRFVRLGERRGDFVVVTQGLDEKETVASSGGFKLHSGSAVVINNALAPDASVDPAPPNE